MNNIENKVYKELSRDDEWARVREAEWIKNYEEKWKENMGY